MSFSSKQREFGGYGEKGTREREERGNPSFFSGEKKEAKKSLFGDKNIMAAI
jgi:hypothetical protein